MQVASRLAPADLRFVFAHNLTHCGLLASCCNRKQRLTLMMTWMAGTATGSQIWMQLCKTGCSAHWIAVASVFTLLWNIHTRYCVLVEGQELWTFKLFCCHERCSLHLTLHASQGRTSPIPCVCVARCNGVLNLTSVSSLVAMTVLLSECDKVQHHSTTSPEVGS
jgi:hypothetical protein